MSIFRIFERTNTKRSPSCIVYNVSLVRSGRDASLKDKSFCVVCTDLAFASGRQIGSPTCLLFHCFASCYADLHNNQDRLTERTTPGTTMASHQSCWPKADQLGLSNDIYALLTISTATNAPTTATTFHTLDSALTKLAQAVAFFRQTSPSYAQRSEALWVFCAGSWNREMYERRVAEAAERLPRRLSVRRDAEKGQRLVGEALVGLKNGGLWRDANDLTEAIETMWR